MALEQLELAGCQRAIVELHAGEPPGIRVDRLKPRLQQRLVIHVRLLQMLRGHEQPLGPNRLARMDHVTFRVLSEVGLRKGFRGMSVAPLNTP